MPVLICQFIYMNLIAITRFQTVLWDMSLEYQEKIMPPALLFSVESGSGELPIGNCTKVWPDNPSLNVDCSANMHWNHPFPVPAPFSQHFFDPREPQQTLEQGAYIVINLPLTCTCLKDIPVAIRQY
jgi:hypothetical protein